MRNRVVFPFEKGKVMKDYSNGILISEMYIVDGIGLHRNNGPAIIVYNENETLNTKCFYLNDKIDRVGDYPSIIEYNDDGNVIMEIYYHNGLQHRETGPQLLEYDGNGNIIKKHYKVNGNNFTKFYNSLYKCNTNKLIEKINRTKIEDKLKVIKIFLIENDLEFLVDNIDAKLLVKKMVNV